jgi:AcrR family transcriptional regulator
MSGGQSGGFRSFPTPPAPDARLLTVAAEHLRRFGPRRITVVGVAEEAGMSHANVYRYFPSKRDLVDAVVATWLKGVEADLADIAGAPDPADDKLERMVLALARAQRERLEDDPHLIAAMIDAIEGNRSIARKHRIRVRALIERVLDEGLSTGVFEVRDRERALTVVLDCMHRFLNPATIRQDAEMPRAALDGRLAGAMKVVLRALAHATI